MILHIRCSEDFVAVNPWETEKNLFWYKPSWLIEPKQNIKEFRLQPERVMSSPRKHSQSTFNSPASENCTLLNGRHKGRATGTKKGITEVLKLLSNLRAYNNPACHNIYSCSRKSKASRVREIEMRSPVTVRWSQHLESFTCIQLVFNWTAARRMRFTTLYLYKQKPNRIKMIKLTKATLLPVWMGSSIHPSIHYPELPSTFILYSNNEDWTRLANLCNHVPSMLVQLKCCVATGVWYTISTHHARFSNEGRSIYK